MPRKQSQTNDGDSRGSAQLRLRRASSVEDAHTLVLVDVVDRQAPVLRTGGDQDGAGGDLVRFLQAHEVAAIPGLERDRTEWRGYPRVELPRLGDGAA